MDSKLILFISVLTEKRSGVIFHKNKMCAKTHRLPVGGRMEEDQENGPILPVQHQIETLQFVKNILKVIICFNLLLLWIILFGMQLYWSNSMLFMKSRLSGYLSKIRIRTRFQ